MIRVGGCFFLTVLLLMVSSIHADSAVPLTFWPNKTTGPFVMVRVKGSAFIKPVSMRFDTAGDNLIVPEGCINPANVTVIVPNTTDQWGNPAKIVTGQVMLVGADGTKYIVNDLPFFVDKGKPCNYRFKNFGAGMAAYSANDKTPCVGNFFNYYNYPKGMMPGFTVDMHNMETTHEGKLIIGKIATGSYSYQLPYRDVQTCINQKKISSCTAYQHWGSSVPDVNITIGSVKITNYNAMIDTGGGMTIIRDTPDGKYIAALKNTLKPCPADIDFLQSCQCLPTDQPISVKILGRPPIQYDYSTSDVSQTQTSAVAICPNAAFDRQNSPNPYVFTKGVNLGFNFFNHNQTVSYDIKSCTINVAMG